MDKFLEIAKLEEKTAQQEIDLKKVKEKGATEVKIAKLKAQTQAKMEKEQLKAQLASKKLEQDFQIQMAQLQHQQAPMSLSPYSSNYPQFSGNRDTYSHNNSWAFRGCNSMPLSSQSNRFPSFDMPSSAGPSNYTDTPPSFSEL
jgi:hypothetical protein